MYFFNRTCLCLSGYKPYIIKKTKFESDCQIIGSAQNESFHARKMKRTCFNPCRGLRGFRRSRPAALTSIGYRGFAVAPMTIRAPSRNLIYSPGDERARNAHPYGGRTPSTAAGGPPPSKREVLGFRRSKPAALPSIGYRGFAVAPITLRAPADILPTFDFPVPIPPSSREGDRPVGGGRSSQAPEGVKNPAGRDFSLGGVSFMPLGISPADEHRRPRRTASLRWRSRPARRRRLHR